MPISECSPLKAGQVAAHISNGEPYTASYSGGVTVRGVAINIMPA